MKFKRDIVKNLSVLTLIAWLSFLLTPLIGSFKYFYISNFNGGNVYFRKTLSLIEKSWILWLALFIVFAALVFKQFLRNKKLGVDNLTINIIGISSLIVLVMSRYAVYIEGINFPNYLYSQFGLKIPYMERLFIASAIVAVIYLRLMISKTNLVKKRNFDRVNLNPITNPLNLLKISLLLGGLAVLVYQSMVPFLQVQGYIGYANKGYDKRFEHFEYIEQLREHTSLNSNVVLPPQGVDWPAFSNIPIVRFFLHPRVLISSSLIEQNLFNEVGALYFVNINEEGVKRWPEFDRSNKLVYFDQNRSVSFSSIELISNENNIEIFVITP